MSILKIKVHGGVDRGRSQVGDDGGRSQEETQSSAKTKAHGGTDEGAKEEGSWRSLKDDRLRWSRGCVEPRWR